MPDAPLHARPREFRAALEFTAAQTGFQPRLVEKDYWCSLVLRGIFTEQKQPLVFKGGTLLSKAYAGFDRLSEDLDFTLPTAPDLGRTARSARAQEVKARLDIVAQPLGLSWRKEWQGQNESKQHTGRLAYPSLFGREESILIEVGQREEVLLAVATPNLLTLLQDPLHSEAVLSAFPARALSLPEAYAEKTRAAFTRREPAIRDLYDLWQASQAAILPVEDGKWLELTRQKCAGLDLAQGCSGDRLAAFRRGIQSELAPVLRSGAIDQFDFEDACALLRSLHGSLCP